MVRYIYEFSAIGEARSEDPLILLLEYGLPLSMQARKSRVGPFPLPASPRYQHCMHTIWPIA